MEIHINNYKTTLYSFLVTRSINVNVNCLIENYTCNTVHVILVGQCQMLYFRTSLTVLLKDLRKT